MDKPNKRLKSEEGSGLVLVLMVLMVLAVLGSALGMVTINSHQLADHTQDTNSAYYIAEAGANMAYAELKQSVKVLSADTTQSGEGFIGQVDNFIDELTNPLTEDNIIIYSGEYFEEQSGKNPEAIVRVDKDAEIKLGNGNVSTKEYVIQSTGSVDGKERTVTKEFTISWEERVTESTGLPTLPGEPIIISKNKVVFDQNTTIVGDIHIDGMSPESLRISPHTNFDGTVYFHPNANTNQATNGPKPTSVNRSEPLPWADYLGIVDFTQYSNKYNQSYPTMDDSILESNPIVLDKNYSKTELILAGNTVIDTNGREVTIVVDDLVFNYGTISLAENAKINIYVKNSIKNINNGMSMNFNGSHNNLKIFYAGEETYNLGHNDNKLNATIVVKDAPIHVKGSWTPLAKGVILTGGTVISFTDNARFDGVIIAPNAKATIEGGSTIIGQFVMDSLYADQRDYSNLIYNSEHLADFPFGDNGSGDNSNQIIEDIISSAPATEK